jgi:hypothetical protein
MKNTLIALSLLVSFGAFAQDMSRTETYEESHRDLEDGSTEYIGGCSVHQDYEDKKFIVTETIVETFEPEYDAPVTSTIKKLVNVEKELLAATAAGSDSDVYDFFANVDDFTLEKISHKTIKGLDLYRWNIGVGGGNGYYEVYNRTVVNGKPAYKKLSNIFDGDIDFCDASVWKK